MRSYLVATLTSAVAGGVGGLFDFKALQRQLDRLTADATEKGEPQGDGGADGIDPRAS